MGRFRRRMYEEYRQEFSTDESYNLAYRKVRRIKGFYTHLKIYCIVNAIIIISAMDKDFMSARFQEHELLDWDTYATAFFWGIGLLVHAVSVFGRDIFFGEDWEARKIKQFMDEENKQKWQ